MLAFWVFSRMTWHIINERKIKSHTLTYRKREILVLSHINSVQIKNAHDRRGSVSVYIYTIYKSYKKLSPKYNITNVITSVVHILTVFPMDRKAFLFVLEVVVSHYVYNNFILGQVPSPINQTNIHKFGKFWAQLQSSKIFVMKFICA